MELIKVMELIKDENGILNCFQPVKGGFRFIGNKEDARNWIQDKIAILIKLEEKYEPKEFLQRILCETLDFEMIEDLYVACMKVREDYKKDLENEN